MRTSHREPPVSLPSSSRAALTTNTYKASATSQNQTTYKVLQSIVKGRRSWKTLGGGEVVWPPKLEAALLKGLERYQPDDSRETRLLGRFPMRNHFISDYIFSTTGKRRTAKQVGSRLQQLKVTGASNRRLLMSLVSPLGPSGHASRHRGLGRRARRGHDSETTADTSSKPTTPTNIQNCGYEAETPMIIHIDLLPDSSLGSYTDSFDQAPAFDGLDIAQASQQPRWLQSIDPTVTFVSRSPISARSYFTVKSAGMSVFSETTFLTAIGPAPNNADGALLFSTRFVPGWWDKILESPDPTQYTILQEVINDGPTSFLAFSAVYKFRYPPGSPHHDTHSLPMSSGCGEGPRVKYEPQESFDYLIPMESPLSDMGCKRVEPYQNHLAFAVEPIWGGQYSPLQIPVASSRPPIYGQLSFGGKPYDGFDALSPLIPASFPTGPSVNYGIH